MSNFTTFQQIRDHSREEAKKALLKNHPVLMGLFNQMDVYMGQLVLRMKDKPSYDDKDQHFYPLIVTFIRLHYSIVGFLQCCDVIEASVLLRKQTEIIARYHEVEQNRRLRANGVPNMSAISNESIRRIYNRLSAIAHFSKDETYRLLGYENTDKESNATTVITILAEYDDKVMDTISDFCEVFDYFFQLMQTYQLHLDSKYSSQSENSWHKYEFVPMGKEIGIKYFVNV